tara:strand:+ start:568 stop:1086 length:519 start_codon:yes stop_codon:yes gene_type:complete
MFKALLPAAASVFLFAGASAHANIEVSFIESAPKDRFVISNTGQCELKDVILNLDLSNSSGRLIFDTTATGAGVDVFQPFEVRKGNMKLLSSDKVEDGDSMLSLSIESIQANDSVSFTIDVDDTLPQSELGNIRVSGSEITNASAEIIVQGNTPSVGMFKSDGKAFVLISPC